MVEACITHAPLPAQMGSSIDEAKRSISSGVGHCLFDTDFPFKYAKCNRCHYFFYFFTTVRMLWETADTQQISVQQTK